MLHSNILLSEALRPTVMADLIGLPLNTRNALQRMIDTKSPMNMIFYGKAGTGKTSTARILINELDCDVLELNGSKHAGTTSNITDFCNTTSLLGKSKLVFIDEADYLHKDIQAMLRYDIENNSDRVRFIFTANDYSRFMDAITSRCLGICFDIPVNDLSNVLEQMIQLYTVKLDNLGYTIEPDKIRKIVCFNFPDFRSIANRFQLELSLKAA